MALDENKIYDLGPLSGLTQLTSLSLRSNDISDLSPLSTLQSLVQLDLGNNQIQDILPLLNMESLRGSAWGADNILDLSDNPLNTLSTNVYVPMLIDAGVNVILDSSLETVDAITV